MSVALIREREEWNRLVKSFPGWDVYYLYEYARSLELHGDGTPVLVYWKGTRLEVCWAAMLQDIAIFDGFHGSLEAGRFYDLETPYGYGGPLVRGTVSEEELRQFERELAGALRERRIVSQFFRFDPFVEEQRSFFELFEARSFKETVYMDLESEELIFKNMDPKNRNMVRKARKNQVEIISDSGERSEDFIRIYEETMRRRQAEDYYYFKREYIAYLKREFREHLVWFYALCGQQVISAAMFLCNDRFMHYHLSGTLWEYRKLASVNLLLYEAALWGCRRGMKKLHLGGGMEKDDSLYGFKKQFNRSGALPFAIGRFVSDPDAFAELVKRRAEADPTFDAGRPFLITYRG